MNTKITLKCVEYDSKKYIELEEKEQGEVELAIFDDAYMTILLDVNTLKKALEKIAL